MADFDDDLALLASELNRTAPIPVADFAMAPRAMETWLSALRSSGAQDLLIVPGAPPTARDQDTLTPLTDLPVDGLEVEGLVLPLLAPRHVDAYRRGQTVDSAFDAPGLGRFRLHLHRGRGRAAATIHALPLDIPTLDALGATHDLSVLCTLTRGLVLVAGPAGAGSTTAVAAIVNAINQRDARHIVIVDDPIEYEHTHGRSVVEHIEVETDVPDTATAVRAATRQRADVVAVGDIATPEAALAALAAAESGALVLATCRATTMADAIASVAAAHPPSGQSAAWQALSRHLAAVLVLAPIGTSRGRRRAFELLVRGPGSPALDSATTNAQLRRTCTTSPGPGSFTLHDSVRALVERGDLSPDEAAAWLSPSSPDLG